MNAMRMDIHCSNHIHFWFISLTNLWTYKTVCASLLLCMCVSVGSFDPRRRDEKCQKPKTAEKKSRAFAHYYNEIKTKIAKHSDTGAIKLLYKKLIDKRTRRAHTHTHKCMCASAQGRIVSILMLIQWFFCLFVCLSSVHASRVYISFQINFFLRCDMRKYSLYSPIKMVDRSPHKFLLLAAFIFVGVVVVGFVILNFRIV